VHDVVNTAPRHAVSVHAYSPPLTAMSYYAVDPSGGLVRTRSVLTDGGAA
jgi:Cysteine dioxygenase type I